MKMRLVVGGGIVAIAALYLLNASWLASSRRDRPEILAHRGIHQTFGIDGLAQNGCTANRIYPPANPYLENTLPSMRATFAAGADALELDIHPTTDGEFAVFHDWMLDCRTNGHGVTRHQSMAQLKTLDIGYGYTADGGKTYPFRGKGVGMMPTLDEVLSAFPGRQFAINIKSRDPSEGERLFNYIRSRGYPTDRRLWIIAHEAAVERLTQLAPRARIWSTSSKGKACVVRYLALGWTGYVPEACKGGAIGIPLNYAWAYWGWPNRLQARMREARVDVVLVGPVHLGDGNTRGVDALEDFRAVPTSFSGVLVTNEIALVGPAVHKRWSPP